MLRFIVKRKSRQICGLEGERLFSIDFVVPELEENLRSGGFGEDTYDVCELVGVEVLDDKNPRSEP